MEDVMIAYRERIMESALALADSAKGTGVRLHMSPDARLVYGPLVEGTATESESRMKPLGMWYDYEGEWLEWCVANQNNWLYPFVYEVAPPENILRISTPEELDRFHDEYALRDDLPRLSSRLIFRCDWDRLYQEYDGIEIIPYQWERRLEYIWYYGWDVASGAVWRNASIRLAYRYDNSSGEYRKEN